MAQGTSHLWLVSVQTDRCGVVTDGSRKHTNYETTISSVPDNVLLEIFNSCRSHRDLHNFDFNIIWDWYRLAHVCQRWRCIILSSPCSLDLQLFCTWGTPVRKNLGSWSRLPLTVAYYLHTSSWGGVSHKTAFTPSDEDNVLAALEDSERVRYLGLTAQKSLLEKLDMTMRKPFPELTHLSFFSPSEFMPPLPDEFLGGSAPELRVMELQAVPFPGLPQLLLSTRRLIDLRLLRIPNYDHFSPKAMFTALEALTELRTLLVEFQIMEVPPSNTILPVPSTRFILPSLNSFKFFGGTNYLEDLLAHLDTPRLNNFVMSYFIPLHPQLDFEVPQLVRFIDHAQSHNRVRLKRAEVPFGTQYSNVDFNFERVERVESHNFFLNSFQRISYKNAVRYTRYPHPIFCNAFQSRPSHHRGTRRRICSAFRVGSLPECCCLPGSPCSIHRCGNAGCIWALGGQHYLCTRMRR